MIDNLDDKVNALLDLKSEATDLAPHLKRKWPKKGTEAYGQLAALLQGLVDVNVFQYANGLNTPHDAMTLLGLHNEVLNPLFDCLHMADDEIWERSRAEGMWSES